MKNHDFFANVVFRKGKLVIFLNDLFSSERTDSQLFRIQKNFEIGALLQILGEIVNGAFFFHMCTRILLYIQAIQSMYT